MNLKIFIGKQIKILMVVILIFVTYFINTTTVNAANYTWSCDSSVQVNTPINISISGSGVQWNLDVYVNGTIKLGDGTHETDNVDGNKSISYSTSYTPSSVGTIEISLRGTVTDADKSTIQVSESKTVTVTEASKPPEEQGGGSGNTGSGDTGSGNGSTETPSGNTTHIPQETNPTQTTPEEPTKSNNNYLRSLSVNVGKLTPAFSRERLQYSLEFEEDFDYSTLNTVTVSALAEDSRSRVGGTGAINVKDGENNIEVDVMAEDSSVRTYKISFIKPEIIQQSDLRLSSLVVNTVDEKGMIEEVELTPKFDKETFNYELDVSKDIEKLEVNGQVDNENIVVTIDGADSLHVGRNLVKITLTSPTDENVKSVYQITVNKEDPLFEAANENIELKEKNRKKLIIGLVLGIIGVLAVVLVVLLIINHKKNLKEKAGSEEDEEYDKYNNKLNDEELEEKKKKLFNYDEEDTYLTDKNLKKLSDEYKETAKEIEKDEKEKNESFDKLAGLMESKRLNSNDEEDNGEFLESKEEVEENSKGTDEEKELKIKEDEVLAEEDYNKDDEARAKKLAELEKEIKDKRKKLTKKHAKEEFDKDEFLKDIKNKKSKD